MKFALASQNPLEWLALKSGMLPTPLAYSHFGFLISKFLLEAVDKGVFEAIGNRRMTVAQIAEAAQLNVHALKPLLAVLASLGLINSKGELLFLTAKSKKWLLKASPHSVYWHMMFDNRVCWKWMDHVGEFLKTGKGLQYHQTFNEEEWLYYQKAVEVTGTITAKEAGRKTPVPQGATRMLDIGGAHGLYSIELCKKHLGLTSVILDLPEAVDKAALASHPGITYRKGNILTDDLEVEQYDAVLMASLAHHFTAEENMHVARKAYDALKPGGTFTIYEVLRSEKIRYNGDMLSAIGDMFFALSSTSGLWSLNEIKGWLRQAGFTGLKKASFLSLPGYVAVSGRKQ